MRRLIPYSFFRIAFFTFFILCGFLGNAQDIRVDIQGGAQVNLVSPPTTPNLVQISAGNSLTFRVTNSDTSICKFLKVKDIDLSGATAGTSFSINPLNPKDNIKPSGCNGDKDLYFTITRTDNVCSIGSVTVTIETDLSPTFYTFTFQVNRSSEIYVLGGSPWADINDGDTFTDAVNGTYFGVVDEGDQVTHSFIVANIGNCDLVVQSASSSNPDFVAYSPYGDLPPDITLPSYYYTIIYVTFTAPIGGSGTQPSVISVGTDNGTFTFTVTAEMFNFNIPGPGGITADFRTWLQATRGITKDGNSKVSEWKDVGASPKNATQGVIANQPTYKDDVPFNINFNPVVEFKNDGSISQYLENIYGGFFNQDIYVVMESDVDVSTSFGMTILSGTTDAIAGYPYANAYVNDINSVSGVGLGDFSTHVTGESLWYNQGNAVSDPYYTLPASTSRAYDKAGIINARNKTDTASDGMSMLYNGFDDSAAATKSGSFVSENLGYIDTTPKVIGTAYKIGKNANATLGNLNGRVAEIFTFAERVDDLDRPKIESYLAIKYGITLGTSKEAQKDYVNSFNKTVWNVAANNGFNYDVAGIGKDSISDLYQRQSKSINRPDEVTIGLGGLYTKNSVNPNDFENDGDFLVWGNNNGTFTSEAGNSIDIGSGISTTLTRIERKWKIVETKEIGTSDVGNVYVGIPKQAFLNTGFTLTSNEEYVLIVADNPNFANTDIIDVIPLKIDRDVFGAPVLDKSGSQVYTTWYHFDDTKYFTFGKAPRVSQNRAISIASGDYLVGEFNLNLNVDNFSIAAWIKCPPTSAIRTIMAKGEKLQMRLNADDKIEILIDNIITPKFVSNMTINDNKWHHLAFVYESGSVILYIDGIIDKSVQDIVHPSPNYNHFSIGAVYINNHLIINPLLGDVDEASVWDIALSKSQVHYIMNQEIQNEGGNVSGKVLPYSATSNEIPAIPWSGLRAYYNFNNFYGSTTEGLTNDRYFLRLQYLNKVKTVSRTQTMATPYKTTGLGTGWDDEATWVNGADIALPNTVGVNGAVVDWNIVELNHDVSSGDRDISLLGLKVKAGATLTMDGVTTMVTGTGTGHSLTISHYLEIDGDIDLEGESQLIQLEGSVLDADSGGFITRDQQGTINGFNYNYWSSSVAPSGDNNTTVGTGLASSNPSVTLEDFLHDGTTPFSFTSAGYNSTVPWNGFPPPGIRSIYTYWLYKFYGAADDYNAWEKINETTPLQAGEGFTMKGPLGDAPIADYQNYVFKGLPNNGDISLPLIKEITVSNPSGNKEYLIGNPYPSAIDATEFILDNISVADGGNNTTGNVINGALYFWDHFGQSNSHVLKEYVGGYATRNLTGGAPAISNDIRINDNMAIGTKVPGQFIPVNQGFFVSSDDGGNIIFKNRQRFFVTELEESEPGVKASVFMKPAKGKTSSKTTNNNIIDNTPTIRLMYDSPLGYHRQLVIGANKNASLGFDLGYDAILVDVNKEDMYWDFNNNKYVIQGVGNFDESQEFALALIVSQSGTAKIRLDALENLPENTELYIKDSVTNETFKINNAPFEINLTAGTYSDRFKLVFQSSQSTLLNTDEVIDDTNDLLVYFNSETSKLEIINTSQINIKELYLYNLLGQKLDTIKINSAKNISVPLKSNIGVYIVKLKTEKGLVNKKIILK